LQPEAVAEVLCRQVRQVLELDDGALGEHWRELRFDQDLHADSLDLVEVVEGVERALRADGYDVTVPEAELVALRTLGDAVDRLLAGARPRS
jgi:acyl carrier protein